MAYTRLQARTLARLYAVDTDSTDPALTDAQWNLMLDTAYLDYARTYPEQFSKSSSSPLATVALVTGQYVYDVTVGAGVIEFTGAVLHTGSVQTTPIERADFDELRRLANTEALSSTTPYPRSWGVRRITDTTCQFCVYPAPGTSAAGKSVYVFGYAEPALPTSDATTYPYTADSEVMWIARLAAIRGASIMGRNGEFIDRLWSDLPQKMQLSMRKHESFKRPNVKPAEVVT